MKISLNKAIELFSHSCVIAIPTETVWGLAAPIDNEAAVASIFSLKKRPPQNPLIIHLGDKEDITHFLKKDGIRPYQLFDLIDAFWPGPLTVVIPIDEAKIPSQVRANLPTAAFRIPNFEGTQELIRRVGPLVAPSANISGKPSATKASDVEFDFGSDFPCFFPEGYLDEGTSLGVESTILIWNENLTAWTIGRLGALSLSDIARALPKIAVIEPIPHEEKKQDLPICPGQLFRHYSPDAKLTLGVDSIESVGYDALIGFSDRIYPPGVKFYSLGSSKNVHEVLHNLYSLLRSLDQDSISSAWVDILLPEDDLLWSVVLDRLTKASQ